MRRFRALADLVLYTNLWLAAGAWALTAQTQWVLGGRFLLTPLLGFVFFATLLLYILHRLVGLKKLGAAPLAGRYLQFARFKPALSFLLPVASGLAAYFFLELPVDIKRATAAPALIALAYVLPIWRGRRLRDLHYIKIFLIALVWSWVTVYLPALELGLRQNIPMVIMCLERMLFLFALTLPFDIRDLEADRQDGVKTLPARLGLRRAKALALMALAGMLALAALNFHIDVYASVHFAALACSAVAAGALILAADPKKSDYFYLGALDGMTLLPFALMWLLPLLS